MPIDKLNIAVIGCGAIFERNHLKGLLESGVWNIQFLIDPDKNILNKYATLLGCGFSTDCNDIPKDIDACLVATPNFLHAAQSIDLIRKGFHVICEKPMALNSKDALEIRKTALEENRHFFVVHQRRFQKNISYLKEQILPFETIKSVDISLGYKFNWISNTNFYASPQKSGGGAIIDLGVHIFDILFCLWKSITWDKMVFSAIELTDPLIDNGFTGFGKLNSTIPFSIRSSRNGNLNNAVRLVTESSIMEASFNDGSLLSITDRKTQNKVQLQLGEAEDLFKLYWKSVYGTINGDDITGIRPTDANEGIAILSCIEDARFIGEIIKLK